MSVDMMVVFVPVDSVRNAVKDTRIFTYIFFCLFGLTFKYNYNTHLYTLYTFQQRGGDHILLQSELLIYSANLN